MILAMNFEELTALRHGTDGVLGADSYEVPGVVLAPPEQHVRVARLRARLDDTVRVDTLHELREVLAAVETVLDYLRHEMEVVVVQTHPADEMAVSAYFDYAHVTSFRARLEETEAEMEAMIELMTGREPDAELARKVVFPD